MKFSSELIISYCITLTHPLFSYLLVSNCTSSQSKPLFLWHNVAVIVPDYLLLYSCILRHRNLGGGLVRLSQLPGVSFNQHLLLLCKIQPPLEKTVNTVSCFQMRNQYPAVPQTTHLLSNLGMLFIANLNLKFVVKYYNPPFFSCWTAYI